MNQHYNQNYTREQIDEILAMIKDCIREGRFIISRNENRQENIEFMIEYNLNSKRQIEILLNIKTEDFCHSLQNIKTGYEHEVLYVFCPQVKLFNFDGIEKLVDIYTKFNLIESENRKRVIVISFHKRNKPIDYLFR
jgi:glycerophosphoryl diester phosphodiesterase